METEFSQEQEQNEPATKISSKTEDLLSQDIPKKKTVPKPAPKSKKEVTKTETVQTTPETTTTTQTTQTNTETVKNEPIIDSSYHFSKKTDNLTDFDGDENSDLVATFS